MAAVQPTGSRFDVFNGFDVLNVNSRPFSDRLNSGARIWHLREDESGPFAFTQTLAFVFIIRIAQILKTENPKHGASYVMVHDLMDV